MQQMASGRHTRKISMLKRSLLIGALTLSSMPSGASQVLPNAQLKIAVRQEADGKLGKAVHVFELSCWAGKCTLSTVTLNQCLGGGFYPTQQRSSTADGTLKAVSEEGALVLTEENSDLGGDSIVNLRFKYMPTKQGGAITRLVGFSGGFVKNSALLKEVITVKYVPLPKDVQKVKLDCDMLLPGIAG